MRRAISRPNLTKKIPYVVTDRRPLNLHDIGTEITEKRPKVITGKEHRRLNHPDAFEQSDHAIDEQTNDRPRRAIGGELDGA